MDKFGRKTWPTFWSNTHSFACICICRCNGWSAILRRKDHQNIGTVVVKKYAQICFVSFLHLTANFCEWSPIQSVIIWTTANRGPICLSWVWLQIELDGSKFFYQLIKSKTKIQIEKHRLYVSMEKTTINSAKCATTVVHMTRTVHLHRNDVSTVLSHRAITSMTRTLSY